MHVSVLKMMESCYGSLDHEYGQQLQQHVSKLIKQSIKVNLGADCCNLHHKSLKYEHTENQLNSQHRAILSTFVSTADMFYMVSTEVPPTCRATKRWLASNKWKGDEMLNRNLHLV